MKRKHVQIAVALISLWVAATQFSSTRPITLQAATATHSPRPLTVQFDDPYADFRNARYSNDGLLNERDEIKLGTQLHREVTKRFRLTDVGLARVDRLGRAVGGRAADLRRGRQRDALERPGGPPPKQGANGVQGERRDARL